MNPKNWKYRFKIGALCLLLVSLSVSVGCAKYGCPNMSEQNLDKKRYKSKSGLFDKKMRKKK